MSQVPPPENIIALTNEICIFLYRFHSLSNEHFLTKTILQKCQSWKISIFCNRLHWLPNDCIFAFPTTFWKLLFQRVSMNLANEIPFFWHVATKGFSLDFKWDLDFGYFFLALSFFFFTYLIHCFQFWKIWNTELFVLKSASHERSAFFVCNRLHWLPKDDCIFAVGFLKMTTFWKPNSEYYNKQKMSLIFCHIRFVTAMHELG